MALFLVRSGASIHTPVVSVRPDTSPNCSKYPFDRWPQRARPTAATCSGLHIIHSSADT